MAYIDQAHRPSPTGVAAVVAIHAAIAGILVTGLTVSGVIAEDEDFIAVFVPEPIEPEPQPPEPEPRADAPAPPVYVPVPPIDIPSRPYIASVPNIPPPLPTADPGPVDLPGDLPGPTPSASLGIDPVGAKPRNDPRGWLSNDDYRPSWARRELTGTARYRLEIAADGRVSDCSITTSTGHGELDEATCRLIERRARFEPARGREGQPVRGSYTGAVTWRLPE